MSRMRIVSDRPAKKPATAPINEPTTIATPTVTTPTSRLTRLPTTIREYTSRTLASSPKKCSGWLAGQPRRWMHGAARTLAPVSCASSIDWFGSWVRTTSAKTATNTRSAMIASPTTADRWRRTLRAVSRHRFGAAVRVAVCGCGVGARSSGGATLLIDQSNRMRGSRSA